MSSSSDDEDTLFHQTRARLLRTLQRRYESDSHHQEDPERDKNENQAINQANNQQDNLNNQQPDNLINHQPDIRNLQEETQPDNPNFQDEEQREEEPLEEEMQEQSSYVPINDAVGKPRVSGKIHHFSKLNKDVVLYDDDEVEVTGRRTLHAKKIRWSFEDRIFDLRFNPKPGRNPRILSILDAFISALLALIINLQKSYESENFRRQVWFTILDERIIGGLNTR